MRTKPGGAPGARRRGWLGAIGGLVLIAAVGCGSTPSTSSTASDPAAPPAGSSSPVSAAAVTRVSADQFRVAASRPGVVVLDVRTAAEYAEGHLPGARNIDVERPDFASRVAALDRGASYAVYCRSGNRSQLAARIMAQAGLTRIVELDGGILALQRAGVSLVTQ